MSPLCSPLVSRLGGACGQEVLRDQGGRQPFPGSEGGDASHNGSLEEAWGLGHEEQFCISAVLSLRTVAPVASPRLYLPHLQFPGLTSHSVLPAAPVR